MDLNPQPAVFFDRDGVLNNAIIKDNKPYPPASLADVVVQADTVSALQQLKACGFLLIGVTNQPDVARGSAKIAMVTAIHHYLMNGA